MNSGEMHLSASEIVSPNGIALFECLKNTVCTSCYPCIWSA